MPKFQDTNGFIASAMQVHGDRYIYDLVDYIRSRDKVTIVCREHGAFTQTPNSHQSGSGCPKCGEIKRARLRVKKSADAFIKRAIEKHGTRYGYSKVVYRGEDIYVEIGCPVHGVFKQTPGNHLSGKGCRRCAIAERGVRRRTGMDEFIERSVAVHGAKYNYQHVSYKTSQTKVKILCPKHGLFLKSPAKHMEGQGCPKCGVAVSRGERMVARWLERHGVSFTTEASFPNLVNEARLRFDFFVPSPDLFCRHLLIEYDGRQHFEPVSRFGGRDELMRLQERDAMKNEWSKSNGYDLLRIAYTEFDSISSILESNVPKVFWDQKKRSKKGRRNESKIATAV